MNWLTAFPISVCIRRSSTAELVPLDLEIEVTFRRNNAKRKRKLLHDKTVASILEKAYFSESSSSNSPTSRESQAAEFEAKVMAEEQPRRVTLEDYSSTSVPQFLIFCVCPHLLTTIFRWFLGQVAPLYSSKSGTLNLEMTMFGY